MADIIVGDKKGDFVSHGPETAKCDLQVAETIGAEGDRTLGLQSAISEACPANQEQIQSVPPNLVDAHVSQIEADTGKQDPENFTPAMAWTTICLSLPAPDYRSPCGLVSLFNRDWYELAPLMPARCFGLVITDPPYSNVTDEGHCSTVSDCQELGFAPVTAATVGELARDLCALSRSWVLMTADVWHMSAIYRAGVLVRFGVWLKPNSAPQFTGDRPGVGWEACAICHEPGHGYRWNGSGKHGIWKIALDQKGPGGHPTQKPVQLYRHWIADFMPAGTWPILDPMMGSGSSGVAAVERGHPYVGVERDPKWFELARKRIDAAARQGMLPL